MSENILDEANASNEANNTISPEEQFNEYIKSFGEDDVNALKVKMTTLRGHLDTILSKISQVVAKGKQLTNEEASELIAEAEKESRPIYHLHPILNELLSAGKIDKTFQSEVYKLYDYNSEVLFCMASVIDDLSILVVEYGQRLNDMINNVVRMFYYDVNIIVRELYAKMVEGTYEQEMFHIQHEILKTRLDALLAYFNTFKDFEIEAARTPLTLTINGFVKSIKHMEASRGIN